MLKALVPVDGSENALCAVRHVIKLVQDREPLEIHLLNVQPELHGDVTTFVPQKVVDGFHREEGEKALKAARELLDGAGIPYRTHIVIGRAASAIAHCAEKLGCDKVIMGTRGLGTATHLLLGSISHEAVHQMDPRIPVTLVKAGYSPQSSSAGQAPAG